jgi:hypothetical protein
MIAHRAGEVRVIHVVIVLFLVVLIGTPIAIFVGWLTIPSFNVFGFKTPEVSQKKIGEVVEETVDTAKGFTPAQTPTEAMDKFREAIQARNYRAAKKYVTAKYGDLLERAHPAARELGGDIDKISLFAKNNSLESEKLKYFLYALDPFPKNFSAGKPPIKKGDKTFGHFEWTLPGSKLTVKDKLTEVEQFEKQMYQNVLGPEVVFWNPIELLKEGDEWKLHIPTNDVWEKAVTFFIEHEKAHHNGLDSFATEMSRLRTDNASAFEAEVFTKLRNAKK